ncbi:hypothetical protein ED733_000380 [Metarhizium rileyi]|uniref:Uncharacterized protein n=1 Tax=Metarhizium rileyi (strain RCEF 4871) TaxID=1649241 RepID=A0A5C6G1P6_METRR|nr:hypothetical protein ED733_000380 [Metarhizium rileyi]
MIVGLEPLAVADELEFVAPGFWDIKRGPEGFGIRNLDRGAEGLALCELDGIVELEGTIGGDSALLVGTDGLLAGLAELALPEPSAIDGRGLCKLDKVVEEPNIRELLTFTDQPALVGGIDGLGGTTFDGPELLKGTDGLALLLIGIDELASEDELGLCKLGVGVDKLLLREAVGYREEPEGIIVHEVALCDLIGCEPDPEAGKVRYCEVFGATDEPIGRALDRVAFVDELGDVVKIGSGEFELGVQDLRIWEVGDGEDEFNGIMYNVCGTREELVELGVQDLRIWELGKTVEEFRGVEYAVGETRKGLDELSVQDLKVGKTVEEFRGVEYAVGKTRKRLDELGVQDLKDLKVGKTVDEFRGVEYGVGKTRKRLDELGIQDLKVCEPNHDMDEFKVIVYDVCGTREELVEPASFERNVCEIERGADGFG